MKGKVLLIASIAAFVCSCAQAQQSDMKSGNGNGDGEQRKQMQQQRPQNGCCEAPKEVKTEKVESAPSQTVATPEVKVEKTD